MKLLPISNSANAGEEYLRYPMPGIASSLPGVREIGFVPYAQPLNKKTSEAL